MRNSKIGDIRKLITGNPTYVHEDSGIEEVVGKFIDNPVIRAVYVVDKDLKLKGIITIYEILKKVSIDFYSTSFFHSSTSFTGYSVISSISEIYAKDFMNPEIYYIKDNDSVEKAFQLLFTKKAGEIPVVDDNLKLIGDLNVIELLVLWKKYYNKSGGN